MKTMKIYLASGVRSASASKFGSAFALVLALCLLAAPSPALAQRERPAGPRISNGDVVKVEVSGRQDLSGRFTVDSQGSIQMPVLGALKAAGRSTDDLATEISRRISMIQRDIPSITVTIEESGQRRIYVLGAVVVPGSYPAPNEVSIWDAIGIAGGPTEDANLGAVEVIRGDSKAFQPPTTLDVGAAILGGGLDALPKLRPGDTVRVPSKQLATGAGGGLIYVMGAVAAQGPQVFEPDLDLAKLLIRSNPTADADFRKVEIVRSSGTSLVRLQVDMNKYFGNAKDVGNPPLHAGDTVYLHRSRAGFGPLQIFGLVGAVLGLATSIAYLTSNN